MRAWLAACLLLFAAIGAATRGDQPGVAFAQRGDEVLPPEAPEGARVALPLLEPARVPVATPATVEAPADVAPAAFPLPSAPVNVSPAQAERIARRFFHA